MRAKTVGAFVLGLILGVACLGLALWRVGVLKVAAFKSAAVAQQKEPLAQEKPLPPPRPYARYGGWKEIRALHCAASARTSGHGLGGSGRTRSRGAGCGARFIRSEGSGDADREF